MYGSTIPQSNAQTPNRLHLQTSRLRGRDPRAVDHFPTLAVEHVGQRGREGQCGGARANGLTLEEGERFADRDGDDDQGDEEEAVAGGGDQIGEHAVHEEDEGYGTVEDGDTDLKEGEVECKFLVRRWDGRRGICRCQDGMTGWDEMKTYDAEGADEDFWRRGVGVNHLRDEVRGHADDGDHADSLQETADLECGTKCSLRAGHYER